jgi:hypothetical protein
MPVSTVRLLKDRRGFTRPVHIFNPSTAVDTRHCNRPFPIWYRYNLRLNKLGFNLGINLGSTWRSEMGSCYSACTSWRITPNGRIRDIDILGAKLMSNINTSLLAHWIRAKFGKDVLS